MSTTIDERVVEMRFDNKQFESGVQTTMSTLDKLKSSLNMNGATKGFEQIDNAAKKVNISSLGNAVETVRLKFSALEVMAVTALSSITKSILNTGKQLISSFTIDPIKSGFQEYETQINAVQTILANTQSTTKQVVKQVSADTQAEIEATLNFTIESNEKALDDLKKTHKEQLSDYEKLADKELETLEDKHDAEIDALEDYIDNEMKLLKSSHKEKLDLYEEEYMEKLKVIDEERYSKIKAVEDQIDAINELTASEEEQLKLQEQAKKLAELQSKIDNAKTDDDRLKAEENLAEYKAKIAREQLLKEREAQIELLELNKANINSEYDAIEEKLKEEYTSKKNEENELYELKVENLKEENEARKKSLTDIYDEEKKLLKEQLSLEKEAIQERQDAEIDALNASNAVAIKNIEARQNAGAQIETIKVNPSTLQDVNNALDELNTYADKTIYNFTEMTRNIGTFTAAGIDLDTSVKAIKGIANLAAVSGSTSQQASTAMYQLSQALASGTVKLMDWNSVVNAGMGGQVFQDALKETARVHGIAIDDLIAKNGSFRETLKEGWLTADILTETLEKFTMNAEDMTEAQVAEARAMYKATGYTEKQIDAIFSLGKTATEAATKVKTFTQLFDTLKESAQSGWTQTWEILVGDFEEAKELLTEVSKIVGDVISKSADARNEILSGGLSSGWKQLLDSGIADEAGYIESIKEIARSNGDIFDNMVDHSDNFVDALKKSLKEGLISSETLSNAVFNLQSKMSAMTDEEKKAAGYTTEMIAKIQTLSSGLKDGSISMDEFTKKIIRPSGRENIIQALWNAANGLMSVITPIKESFREIFPPMTAEQLYNITNGLLKLTENLKLSDTASANLKSTFKGLFAVFDIIKQAFSAVFNMIKPLFGGFGTLGESILGVTGRIGESIVAFDEFVKTSDAFKKVCDNIVLALKNVKSALASFINKIKEKIDSSNFEIFHDLLDRIKTRLSQIGDIANDMKSEVVEAFKSINEAIVNSQFMKLITSVWNVMKAIGTGIAKIIGKIGKSFSSNIGNINFNFDTFLDIINSLSFGAIALGIKKFVDTFIKITKQLDSIKDSFVGVLDSVKGCLEAYQTQLKAGTLIKIASAIAILVASILAVSLIDSNKLNSSLGAITVMFADLIGSMALFNKFSGNKMSGTAKSIAAMLGMATSILILSGVLMIISNMDWTSLAKGLTGVVSLTIMMTSVAKIMSSGEKSFIEGIKQIVVMATAIKVLASVCEDLSTLTWNELATGLSGLLGIVIIFNTIAKSMTTNGTAMVKGAGQMLIASFSMLILSQTLKQIGTMDWTSLAKGLIGIGTAMAILVVGLNKLEYSSKGAGSLIIAASALIVLSGALKIIGGLNIGVLIQGLIGIGTAMAILVVGLNKLEYSSKGAGSLIIAASALIVLSGALKIIGGLDLGTLIKGLIGIGGAMAILVVGLNAMTGTIAGSAALLVAASAILVFVPAFAMLGAMSWDSIIRGIVALAGAFAILGIAGAILAPIASSILILCSSFALIGLSIVGIGAGLLLIGAGLSAVAIGITSLAAAVAAGATAFIASFTIIITSIASLLPVIISKLGEAVVELIKALAKRSVAIGEALKELVLMVVNVLVECVPPIADGALKLVASVLESLVEYTPSIVDSLLKLLIVILEGIANNLPDLIKVAIDILMAFFSGIVDALKGIDTETLLQGIVGIGLLSVIMLALSAVASLVPGAMIGVLGMGAVIAELALVLAAIGALAQIPGLNWLINEGGDLLQGIGTAIGKFVGGIVGGFMEGVSSQFPKIATDLSGFMTNIQPFLEGAASINPSMMDGVKALGEAILILTAANILDGLASWFTGGSSLTGFAEDLVPFGKAMKQFSEEVSGIEGETVSNAAIAGKTLAEMANTLPNTGGVVGFFTGENDMKAFGEQLVPFGKAIKEFADEVAGLDSDVVTEAATAGKTMIEMAKTIPNSGGVVGFFVGENDMDDFAEQLIPFGKAMKEYAEAVSGLDADVIQNSVIAGKALTELADTVPNTGGVIGWFTGNNDLSTFGDQLVPFGSAMKEYSLSVDGIDADIITNSANAAKALVELSDSLPNTGGLVSWFTGDNDIGSFGKQLATFGDAFSQYYDSIKGVNVSKLSGVVKEFNNLVELANGVKDIDTSGLSNFAKNLKKLADSGIDEFIGAFDKSDERVTTSAKKMITTFIDSANSKKEDIMGAFVSLINSAVTTISCQHVQFTTEGNNTISNFISGVKANDNYVKTSFSTFVSNCLTTISNKYYDFINAGQVVITKFIDGVKAKNQIAKTSFTSIVNGCITSVRNKYTDFYNAGTYLVQKFANGISDYTWYATSKATTMARSTADAMEKELAINSPSKVSYKIAGFFGQGFINNLANYTDKAYDAGESIATSAKDGLRNAVSKISDYIDSGIDSQPTIRPILDLSQVKEGAGKLSALLSRNQAMSIGAVMNRETTGNIQNGDNTHSTGNSYNFVQNNYSPKALSRIDIYRQTKNQFSAMKGLVET